MPWDQIYIWIGKLAVFILAASSLAAFLFRHWAVKWIENRFAVSLAAARHTQAVELQRMRAEIEALISRKIRLQDKEFEVLPDAWKKLGDAFAKVAGLAAPLQTFTDIDMLGGIGLGDHLDQIGFTVAEKSAVKHAADKNKAYADILFWRRVNEAHAAIHELFHYVQCNCVFMSPSLKKDFVDVSNMLWDASAAKHIGHRAGDFALQASAWEQVQQKIEPLRDTIEAKVYAMFRPEGA